MHYRARTHEPNLPAPSLKLTESVHSLRAADCRMCKCQACDFCIGSCASGLLGDTEYTSCEPACDGAIAAEHCNYCRCKECKFCDTGDTASAVSTVQAREPRAWACYSSDSHGVPTMSLTLARHISRRRMGNLAHRWYQGTRRARAARCRRVVRWKRLTRAPRAGARSALSARQEAVALQRWPHQVVGRKRAPRGGNQTWRPRNAKPFATKGRRTFTAPCANAAAAHGAVGRQHALAGKAGTAGTVGTVAPIDPQTTRRRFRSFASTARPSRAQRTR